MDNSGGCFIDLFQNEKIREMCDNSTDEDLFIQNSKFYVFN